MKINSRLFTTAVILLSSGIALAQDVPGADPAGDTIEDRRATREARRAEWEAMSDEERATAREQRRGEMEARREAAREHFEGLSEEERQALRERMQHRRPGGSGRGRPGSEGEAL